MAFKKPNTFLQVVCGVLLFGRLFVGSTSKTLTLRWVKNDSILFSSQFDLDEWDPWLRGVDGNNLSKYAEGGDNAAMALC